MRDRAALTEEERCEPRGCEKRDFREKQMPAKWRQVEEH